MKKLRGMEVITAADYQKLKKKTKAAIIRDSIHLELKPLSVNEAWQGKRFKTPEYTKYQQEVLSLLPPFKMPVPPFKLSLTFGFSNVASDLDNPVKCFVDILQKAYGFNDREITELHVKKEVVKKGKEFIRFRIEGVELFKII